MDWVQDILHMSELGLWNMVTDKDMQNVKFYARVNNPFLISSFKIWDVELGDSGFNYPIQRTWSVGLNISF